MTTRHQEAQAAYTAAKALTGEERKRAVREWQARYPEYERCGSCSSDKVRLKRRPA